MREEPRSEKREKESGESSQLTSLARPGLACRNRSPVTQVAGNPGRTPGLARPGSQASPGCAPGLARPGP